MGCNYLDDGALETMNTNGQLPDGIRKIVSEKSGLVTFEACAGVVNNVKIRKQFGEFTFGSELTALSAAKFWVKEKRREILKDRSSVASISDYERLAYLEAMKLLEPHRVSLLEVVKLGIEQLERRAKVASVLFQDAVASYRAFKAKENCKQTYLDGLRFRFGAMSEFDDQLVSEIDTDELDEFLEEREIGEVSWNNWRRDLLGFFKYCQKQKWINENPVDNLPTKKVDQDEVEILEVAQVRNLLSHANFICPRQINWLVLGLFAGLRRDEADRVRWEDVDFEHGVIKVQGAKLRSMATRYVELTEPARAYLSIADKSEPIVTRRYARRGDLKLLTEATGIACNKNLYRHSYGSYHLAHHQNVQTTMIQMGHTNPQTLVRNYRRPIPKLVAGAYWAISPS